MNEKLLCQLGLSANQAHVYRLLVERKSLRPAQLAKITFESRANCYALLDKLVDMGLARKIDENKKLVYYPESPEVLEKMLSQQVVAAQAKLADLQKELPRMVSVFSAQGDRPRVTIHKGKKELEAMYEEQMQQKSRELYFVRSVADVPYYGITKMKEIRHLAGKHGVRRYGITPIVFYSPSDPYADARTNLKRTWLPKASYTAPVEWAVVGDTVHIIDFKNEGHGVTIKNTEIAESLRQILQLFAEAVKKDPEYKKSPKFVKDYVQKQTPEKLAKESKHTRQN